MKSWINRAFAMIALSAMAVTLTLIPPGVSIPTAIAQPAATELPTDLAMVPADAMGFVHIRLADMWRHEMFAPLKATWEKAGPKAIGILDQQFIPAPSTIERVTFFMVSDNGRPQPFIVLAFSAPFNPSDVVKVYLPDAVKSEEAGKTVYTSKKLNFDVHFPDNKHIFVSDAGMAAKQLARPVAKSGALASSRLLAASKALVVAADISQLPIPKEAFKEIPQQFEPLLKARQVVLSLDLGKEARLSGSMVYADADAATGAEKAVRDLSVMGRKELAKARMEIEAKLFDPKNPAIRPGSELPEAVLSIFALGGMTELDELLANNKIITRAGNELGVAFVIPSELVKTVVKAGAMSAGLLLPAVQKVRMAAASQVSMNNLKQLALSVHNYSGANNDNFPPPAIVDKEGKPLLSWRVMILPYIEEAELYKQFHLNEPWGSEHNKKLIPLMPKVFITPTNPAPPGQTFYKLFVGGGSPFEVTVHAPRRSEGHSWPA